MAKVVGYAGPLDVAEFTRPTWGIRVQPTETVYSPRPPRNEYEVYLFTTATACGQDARTKEDVQKEYGIGTQVQVVAEEWKGPSTRYKRLLLFVDPYLDSRYGASPSIEDTSIDRLFDYATLRGIHGQENGAFSFEWRKDLWRLKRANGDRDKVSTLKRMIAFPYPRAGWFFGSLCPELIGANITDDSFQRDLLKECSGHLESRDFIGAAKGTQVRQLDPKLRETSFEDLLLEWFGTSPTWEIKNCEESNGIRTEPSEDSPVCVEARAGKSKDLFVSVLLRVGTKQTGFWKSKPAVRRIYVIEGTQQHRLEKLHEIIPFLRQIR